MPSSTCISLFSHRLFATYRVRTHVTDRVSLLGDHYEANEATVQRFGAAALVQLKFGPLWIACVLRALYGGAGTR